MRPVGTLWALGQKQLPDVGAVENFIHRVEKGGSERGHTLHQPLYYATPTVVLRYTNRCTTLHQLIVFDLDFSLLPQGKSRYFCAGPSINQVFLSNIKTHTTHKIEVQRVGTLGAHARPGLVRLWISASFLSLGWVL